jgi:uncharacterized protein (DUF433 family)
LAKVAVKCSAETFVVNQSLVLCINIWGKNRHLRQARKRYQQLLYLFNSQLFTTFVFMNIKQYIEINPEKRFGKPVIKGTRISVADVLNWLANGMTRQEIIQDFPELGDEQINACLFFAASREGHLGIAS